MSDIDQLQRIELSLSKKLAATIEKAEKVRVEYLALEAECQKLRDQLKSLRATRGLLQGRSVDLEAEIIKILSVESLSANVILEQLADRGIDVSKTTLIRVLKGLPFTTDGFGKGRGTRYVLRNKLYLEANTDSPGGDPHPTEE